MNNEKPQLKPFAKDAVQSLKIKKGDRILIDGPVEIQVDEFKTDSSLDYVVTVTFSMPRSNNLLKLGPGASSQRSSSFEQQGQKKRIIN